MHHGLVCAQCGSWLAEAQGNGEAQTQPQQDAVVQQGSPSPSARIVGKAELSQMLEEAEAKLFADGHARNVAGAVRDLELLAGLVDRAVAQGVKVCIDPCRLTRCSNLHELWSALDLPCCLRSCGRTNRPS